jgi:sulfate/thiosulfate transport system ATP-binding protein
VGIELIGISKRFAATAALKDISLDAREGEFLALLGPSGSGKTTLLRIIAGLDFPDAGAIRFGGQDVANLSARERKVGFVFQHYALFRHMTVFENIAFGLKVKPRRARPDKAAIAERVHRLLALVQLEGLDKRYPAQLSGGQRQRVALARALAIEPALLLLDEPFGALDAKVRKELRRWLRGLHDEMGLTTIFVTHDQEEALELADRVVVMSQGSIEQIGTTQDVYDHPATPFVHEFIGDANRFEGVIDRHRLLVAGHMIYRDAVALPDGPVVVFVRPHELAIAGERTHGLPARIRHVFAVGSVLRVELEVPDLHRIVEAELPARAAAEGPLTVGRAVSLVALRLRVFPLRPGMSGSTPDATALVDTGDGASFQVPHARTA